MEEAGNVIARYPTVKYEVFSKHFNNFNRREKTGSNGEESDVGAGIKNIEEIFTYSWVLTYSYFCFTCRLKKN